MSASYGLLQSKVGRQVPALLLNVQVRNLAPAPPSQISQSLLHQPHVSDQWEIRWSKDCGVFLFTFFTRAEQTYNLQLQPSQLLSLLQFLCAEGLTYTSAPRP